jgi:hypothetical protein
LIWAFVLMCCVGLAWATHRVIRDMRALDQQIARLRAEDAQPAPQKPRVEPQISDPRQALRAKADPKKLNDLKSIIRAK